MLENKITYIPYFIAKHDDWYGYQGAYTNKCQNPDPVIDFLKRDIFVICLVFFVYAWTAW